MISKQKSAKTEPKSNGRHELKATNGQPKSNGHAGRHAPSVRPRKAAAEHRDRAIETLRGVLEEFNFTPRGGVEGFLLHSDGQTVQVNVTVDVGFAVVRGIGKNVEATVEADADAVKHGKGDHRVFNLIALTESDGKALIFAGDGTGEKVTVQGVVKRFNYARHGEANGVILESGDFIHLKPEGMKKVALKAGDSLTAEGSANLMPLGQQVVEATTVNGVVLTRKRSSR